ncbi:unnamed protein product [Vitrella brassicaformis CCMP3155]|uniref:Uncharacterized protein n=2 Tax=Vitrella brassicaformis TaxID=1169539 RepID=A0A0G4GFI7_VITBC|nr:unnamed protein product [Vitrella brassicaformis CCMP3155]|eukprot:CEM28270.1 unnamed protein product [Vitrella brassicaformis CCMP3155]
MDGPPAKALRTAPPAQSDDSSNRTSPKIFTSLLDGLDLWLNVSSYQSVKERLAMSCISRAFYWVIYSLIRVINWHRPNHGLSCRGPGGSRVTFEQQQHAIILLPREEEVEEIGRARLFAFISLQLVKHTDTLKAIQTAQPKQQPDADGNVDEGSEDAASGLTLAQVKGPDAVFPSVTLDGLHLFQQQKLVCPALERLTGKVLSSGFEIYRVAIAARSLLKPASMRAVFDGSLAFILGSSPAPSHLDIFPLLCCTHYGSVNGRCVVPLTAAALPSLKKLRHVGRLKLQGEGASNEETPRVVSLLRQLTPHSSGGAAASSSSARAAPSPSPCPPGAATKRHLKRSTAPFASSAEEDLGWEVVREGGTTSIKCRGETTEGPPTAETLELVETIKRHAAGGDRVSLDGYGAGSGDPTSPHFSGIQFDNACRLDIELSTDGPDVDAESFDWIPRWLTEETTLKSLSNVTRLRLQEGKNGSDGVSTCDPEYLIPPTTPNRLSSLLSSLPALTHVNLLYFTAHAIMASEVLAYIQQGIAKPLKKLEIWYDEPLSFDRPPTKAAAPVAFPSPNTARQYPRRLRDLFRLVHELRPKRATFKLNERADIFTTPGNASQVERDLDSLFRQSRVRGDMADYGMELRRPMFYKRYDGQDSSVKDLAARPREHQLTVKMVIWPWDDSDADDEKMRLDDGEGCRDPPPPPPPGSPTSSPAAPSLGPPPPSPTSSPQQHLPGIVPPPPSSVEDDEEEDEEDEEGSQ